MNPLPITTVSDDLADVLRPIDFLVSQIKLERTEQNFYFLKTENKGLVKELRLRYKLTEAYLDRFWQVWRNQYLKCHLERYQREHKQGKSVSRKEPKLGKIVILFDEDTHRAHWKLGRIEELIKGRQERVRTAILRLQTDVKVERPKSHLYALEVGSEELQKYFNAVITDDKIEDNMTLGRIKNIDQLKKQVVQFTEDSPEKGEGK
ncbi:unnamed protein product [Enterobius vermicularis]|uniref:DUF5641 domain-containing protein n=1 Tax=Enterobius vermicularis TaxID=51028 RepID=A0A3P6JDU7_ENTVE|nr:unnamed protein product [Enterobius vermicularis]